MGRADSPLRNRLAFLVGARRSGTNWLQRVATAHPDVVGIPSETHLFSHGIAHLAERVQHATPGLARTGVVYMERDAFLDAARDFCDRVFGELAAVLDPRAQLIVERSPLHVNHVGLIGAVYPDARIVHIVRDGRDVARSIVQQPYGPDTIGDAAVEWRESVRSARAAGARLERYVEVRYEDLLADPGARVRELYEVLGLGADRPVLEAALAEAGVPFNVDPAAYRVAAGKWRDALSAREVREFEEIAGDLLDELGYERARPADRSRLRGLATGARRLAASARAPRAALARRRETRFGQEVYIRRQRNQEIFERFLEAVRLGEAERLAELLRPDALVRVVDGEEDWSGRGEPGRERLVAVAAADAALRARQVRGDVHPGVSNFVVMSTYELADGGRADRSLVVSIRQGAVGAVTYYAWPAVVAAPAGAMRV